MGGGGGVLTSFYIIIVAMSKIDGEYFKYVPGLFFSYHEEKPGGGGTKFTEDIVVSCLRWCGIIGIMSRLSQL